MFIAEVKATFQFSFNERNIFLMLSNISQILLMNQ